LELKRIQTFTHLKFVLSKENQVEVPVALAFVDLLSQIPALQFMLLDHWAAQFLCNFELLPKGQAGVDTSSHECYVLLDQRWLVYIKHKESEQG
jgi:hypothetical protein